MESQPQKPEFWNNPENFHPCFELGSSVVGRHTDGPAAYPHTYC